MLFAATQQNTFLTVLYANAIPLILFGSLWAVSTILMLVLFFKRRVKLGFKLLSIISLICAVETFVYTGSFEDRGPLFSFAIISGFVLFYSVLWLFASQYITRKHAMSIVSDRIKLLGSEYEPVEVNCNEFTWLDLNFYADAARAAQAEGFHKINDIELLHLSRIYPQTRTFARVFQNKEGTIRVSVNNQRFVNPKTEAEKKYNRNFITVRSELSDGTFLFVNNLQGATLNREIKGSIVISFDQHSTIARLLLEHELLVKELNKKTGAVLIPYNDFDAARRAFEMVKEDIRQNGLFTKNEILQLAALHGHKGHFADQAIACAVLKISTEYKDLFSAQAAQQIAEDYKRSLETSGIHSDSNLTQPK
ncbi:MAG: hypothetical protein LBE18_09970 [Planctomycetaceae bacterium]|jgi:hypothetical protein|nr:hypothetical protein [Planctomycetaceae bacterium]